MATFECHCHSSLSGTLGVEAPPPCTGERWRTRCPSKSHSLTETKMRNPGRVMRSRSQRALEQRPNTLPLCPRNSQTAESHRQRHRTLFPGTGAALAGSSLDLGTGGSAAGPLRLPGLSRAALLAAFAAGFLHGVCFGLFLTTAALEAGLLYAAAAALLTMAVVPAIKAQSQRELKA